LEVIERVAAELPPSLRRIYRHTAARRNVRDGLRRLRSGLPPSKDNLKNDQKKTRQQSPGEYQQIWRERYPKMIGRSPTLFPVFKALDRVSGSDSMMLIRGESGTGKELVAAALHTHSHRHKGPFVKVNCAAFVETLLLSELFGHEKGAFTGAVSTKKGRFELADGGTLFLDEIGDISPNTQVALLRVLQEGAFERVGGQETVSVNVRVVCATHRNLEEMVKDGTFRADLYYRLRGVVIELPALRDRPTDIPLLVEHFLARQRSARQPNLRFDHDALASLFQHDWPGNIRELENVVRSVVLFADGDTVDMKVLAELGDILPAPSEAAIAALNEALEIANIPIPATTKSATPNTAQNPSENARVLAVPLGGESATGTDMIPAADNLYPWLEKMILDSGSLSEFKKRIEFEAIAGTLREEKGNITRSAKRLGMKRPRLSQIIHGNIELGAIKEKLTESE
jgi:transcriptional regulator with GAF, ATPase, and Fis domain